VSSETSDPDGKKGMKKEATPQNCRGSRRTLKNCGLEQVAEKTLSRKKQEAGAAEGRAGDDRQAGAQ